MPGHVRQNDTNFTLLQEESAPIFRPLRPNFAIGPLYLGQFWGPTAPIRWGAAGESDGGMIDLIEVYWPALTRIGYPSKLGSC